MELDTVEPVEPVAPTAGRGRLLLILGLTAVATLLPFGGVIGFPLAIVSTWAHEISHAAIATVTGQTVVSLDVFTDTSGRTAWFGDPGAFTRGLIASAGYVGTSVIAAVLVIVGRTPRLVGVALGVFGSLMPATSILYGGNVTGRLIIALLGGLILACAFTSPAVRGIVIDVLAAALALNAFVAIKGLFSFYGSVRGTPLGSDADTVADLWLGSAWMWTGIWMLLAIAVVGLALVYRLRPLPAPARATGDPV